MATVDVGKHKCIISNLSLTQLHSARFCLPLAEVSLLFIQSSKILAFIWLCLLWNYKIKAEAGEETNYINVQFKHAATQKKLIITLHTKTEVIQADTLNGSLFWNIKYLNFKIFKDVKYLN